MRQEQLGNFCYHQGAFPLGQDTLQLAAFPTLKPHRKVCDLGCGAGPLPLLLLGREPTLDVTGIELDPQQGDLCRENLQRNGLAGQIITGDLRQVAQTLPAGSFDLVISNPPWFPVDGGYSGGIPRMEHTCTLEELCAAAMRLLRNGGRFALVHRPQRLADLMVALRTHHMEPKKLQLIQHTKDSPPSSCLLEGVRQGKANLTLLPTLILH